ncbi:alcohol dehydrogenase [Trichoderma ceciliae]
MSTMKALTYSAVNSVFLEERPKPSILAPTDAIVRVTQTTICGTDLHILNGDVATCEPGRILGHEGIGIIDSTGPSMTRFKQGDSVLISCISSCAACEYCRKGMYSHCTSGGWILGNTIDGTQAEYVRIPHADSSLHNIPSGVDTASMVLLSDIFPTGLECGVQNGKVEPGNTMAIIGAGPVGLAALMTSRMYSPFKTIVIDTNQRRLDMAKMVCAIDVVNNAKDDAVAVVKSLTGGKGCDTVIEAVGVPATFELAQDLLAPGGTLANVGVHGTKVDLKLQNLWDKNISITTRLVDTSSTPMLMRQVSSGVLMPTLLVTHEFDFNNIEEAYKTFGQASKTGALKVLIEMQRRGEYYT